MTRRPSKKDDRPNRSAAHPRRRDGATPDAHAGAKWKRFSLIGVGVLAFALGVTIWRAGDNDPSAALQGAGENYNVLLITLDTTRADCLGCYGHPVVKTPNIDRLAAEGAMFTQCMATCPLTLPSHASIMTGTYPFVHRARNNGRYLVDDGNETLAEILSQAGYTTGAEVSAYVLDAIWGIGQGFDHYRSETEQLAVGDRLQRMETLQSEPSDAVVSRALNWLDANKPNKFFLWTHFFDPHEPCEPPPAFRRMYRDPYFGEISFVDQQIGRLINALERRGILDQTMIVLTADHGEGRGDHQELTHSYFLYDATMRAPLIFWRPGLITKGRRIDSQVSTVDIAPTILSILGMDDPAGMQGVSLTPLLEGTARDLRLTSYGETLSPKHAFGYAVLRALRADGWKYIHAPKPELFDLRNDPNELRNVAGMHPDRVSKMREMLATLMADAGGARSGSDRAVQLDEEATRKLSALGYVGGYTPPDTTGEDEDLDSFSGPDPKDRIDDYTQFMLARSFDKQGKHESAVPILQRLIQRQPEAPAYRELLGAQLRKLNRTQEAIAQYQKLTELQPRNALAHYHLGRLYGDLNQFDRSAVHLRNAADAMPDDAATWSSLGLALVRIEQYEQARSAFKRVLEIDPHYSGARTELSALAQRRGDWAQAKKLLEQGLELDPNNPEAINNLAWLLATAPDESIRDGEKALQLAGKLKDAFGENNPAVLDTVAAAYAANQRFDDAIRTCQKAVDIAEDADSDLAKEIRERLELYTSHQPYRQR